MVVAVVSMVAAAVSTVAAAVAMVAVAVSMVAVAFIPPVAFVVAAFIPSTPGRAGDTATVHTASNPMPPIATPVARAPAIMIGLAFRTASSQAIAPSRTA